MCGLAGALVFDSGTFEVSERYIARMRDTMPHRGPDGEGIWISPDRKVGLGHRRLAIIDLSDAALQPMCDEAGQVWVIFNGEIYNHAEIRQQLIQAGRHMWKTDHSDTEVIVQAYLEWGVGCVERFRGMFAFALWDARTRELWLVRDRVGIKPLYYSHHHGRLTFASEIKALLEDSDQPRAVDETAFWHYLSFLTTPAPQTLFAGIKKLAAGTWLRVSASGHIEERRYWDAWDHVRPQPGIVDGTAAESVLATLRESVRLRKVSDVPVGVFLSGGIDSSANVALFSEGEVRPVKTFSIGYEGTYASYDDELPYARRMASLVGAEHYERRLTVQDLIDFLPRMVALQDEPIADPVCVPVYYVSALARQQGVTVCQLGEGADELFWGYPSWRILRNLQLLDDWSGPGSLKRLGLAAMRRAGKQLGRPYEFLRRGAADLPVFWGGAEAFTEAEKRHLTAPDLQRRLGSLTSWEAIEPIWGRYNAGAWERSPLGWMSYLDLNLRLPELLLMRVDKMSMGVSLEGRVPFLDHKLVELALGLPEAVKVRHGQLKYVLKKAVRGLLPPDILERKKQGFQVPMQEWFLDRIGSYARDALSEFCAETNYLRFDAVERLIAKGAGPQVWYLLNFALWWRTYIAQRDVVWDREAAGVHC